MPFLFQRTKQVVLRWRTRLFALCGAFTTGIFFALIAVYFHMLVARFSYPLDLEWMEGGILLHVERILHGMPIYTLPSADFIPFAYPPLFYYATAAVSLLFGLSFQTARAVSWMALLSLPFLYFAVAIHPGTRKTILYAAWAALAGFSLVLLEYFTTGAWLDIARPDTLALALALMAGVVLTKTTSKYSAMVAAALLAASIWTKQTMIFPAIAATLWQLFLDARRAFVLGVAIALLSGIPMLLANVLTDNWAWFYIRDIHRLHTFDVHRAWLHTPRLLVSRFSPALVVGAIGLVTHRRISAITAFWWLLAAAGFVAACIGSGTQWAHTNALLPAIVFLPPAIIASWNPFFCLPAQHDSPSMLWMLAFTLLLYHVHTRHPKAHEFQNATPTHRDVVAAYAHIQELRTLPGPLLIPYHPWNARLAGFPGHFHQHALSDIRAAGLKIPSDLLDGVRKQRWKTILHDRFGTVFHRQWPGFENAYVLSGQLRVQGVRTFSGNPCSPRFVWRPHQP